MELLEGKYRVRERERGNNVFFLSPLFLSLSLTPNPPQTSNSLRPTDRRDGWNS
ncbi:hypothetical protein OAV88_02630 [bacterium]|nr:hypothetical protein [bacterium]